MNGVKIENLYKSFGDKKVYEDFSIDFEAGKVTALLGPSGCGKTTLLNIVAGIDRDYTGKVTGGENGASYIFFEPRLVPSLTVFKNLTFAGAKADAAAEILEKVEVDGTLRPGELSGGMAQRVNMARAFLSSAPVMLLDEPFKNLDYALKLRLLGLFKKLLSEKAAIGRTVITVTHDAEDAELAADRAVILCGGKIAEDFNSGFTEASLKKALAGL